MQNEFLELFKNPLTKTSSVTRFSGVNQNTRESLSDHITDVCALSYLIGRKLISKGVDLNMGLLLERGVIHDFDEVLIGDIPRLTKYATKEIHNELDKIAEMTARSISDTIDGTDYTYLVWRNSKDNTIEGFILKVVDILSVSKKIVHEIDFSGNLEFCKVAKEVALYVADLIKIADSSEYIDDISKEYFTSLLAGTIEIMNNLYEERKGKAEIYGVVDDITSYILDNRDI